MLSETAKLNCNDNFYENQLPLIFFRFGVCLYKIPQWFESFILGFHSREKAE